MSRRESQQKQKRIERAVFISLLSVEFLIGAGIGLKGLLGNVLLVENNQQFLGLYNCYHNQFVTNGSWHNSDNYASADDAVLVDDAVFRIDGSQGSDAVANNPGTNPVCAWENQLAIPGATHPDATPGVPQ